MTKVEELEKAIVSLGEDEYSQFRRWFIDRDWEKWDREIEEDFGAGRLDFFFKEAAEAKNSNRLEDL